MDDDEFDFPLEGHKVTFIVTGVVAIEEVQMNGTQAYLSLPSKLAKMPGHHDAGDVWLTEPQVQFIIHGSV